MKYWIAAILKWLLLLVLFLNVHVIICLNQVLCWMRSLMFDVSLLSRERNWHLTCVVSATWHSAFCGRNALQFKVWNDCYTTKQFSQDFTCRTNVQFFSSGWAEPSFFCGKYFNVKLNIAIQFTHLLWWKSFSWTTQIYAFEPACASRFYKKKTNGKTNDFSSKLQLWYVLSMFLKVWPFSCSTTLWKKMLRGKKGSTHKSYPYLH